MAIDVPERGARTLKEFLAQLFTITVGVLVALSIDGIVEWQHHRSLVRDARAMIRQEIEDNRRELKGELSGGEKRLDSLGAALKFAETLLAKRDPGVTDLSIGASMASLDAASWASAERTGALGYMPYAEVKTYSGVYSLQELVALHQERVRTAITASLSILGLGDPTKASTADLQTFRGHLLAAMAEFYAEQQLAGQLVKAYDELLSHQ